MSDETSRDGDRIAKVIARAGVASRRDAEVLVQELRVTVNGRTVSNVATNVLPGDRVTVDGKPLPRPDGARLWLYHKPAGLVTTARDEKGRETVFDALPADLGRVLSVGRLDLNSEGLLLLTNDGELKRQLELPTTGWLRRYRARVNGTPDEAALDRLRAGITVEGDDGPETFAPMQVTLDRQQGANAWLTLGLREGRNREIRRAFAAVDMYVNRLIRVSYGPFQLGTLAAGEVEEVKPRILRDQLGDTFDGELAESRKGGPMADEDDRKPKAPGKGVKPRAPRSEGDRLVDKGRGKPAWDKKGGRPRGPARARTEDAAEARSDRAARPDRPRTTKPPVTRNDGDGSRPARGARPAKDGEGRPRREGDKPRPDGGKPRRDGEKPRFGDGKPRRDGDKPKFESGKPRRDGEKPRGPGDKARSDAPRGAKPAERPKETKGERTARLRADTSVSLRKGGQRGRGVVKPKKAPSTKRMKKPEEGGKD
ncbi:pseudouridine synthase [Jannaschia rubra]|uniref:Pseudouridine synthase n=1 Tax=Jannaschia rubra TaxID=282197 RepID=A0A0M6XUJ7_9RHOB|nr:pseudouridine synthase [Jannaschia rubra]CTQ34287.1 Ribosomal large subunit pseudouridine synthase B [Jannaschia rubra]SFG18752.1 23S rRNA pseudouridine2605 synthase [Jannaschia rubra]